MLRWVRTGRDRRVRKGRSSGGIRGCRNRGGPGGGGIRLWRLPEDRNPDRRFGPLRSRWHHLARARRGRAGRHHAQAPLHTRVHGHVRARCRRVGDGMRALRLGRLQRRTFLCRAADCLAIGLARRRSGFGDSARLRVGNRIRSRHACGGARPTHLLYRVADAHSARTDGFGIGGVTAADHEQGAEPSGCPAGRVGDLHGLSSLVAVCAVIWLSGMWHAPRRGHPPNAGWAGRRAGRAGHGWPGRSAASGIECIRREVAGCGYWNIGRRRPARQRETRHRARDADDRSGNRSGDATVRAPQKAAVAGGPGCGRLDRAEGAEGHGPRSNGAPMAGAVAAVRSSRRERISSRGGDCACGAGPCVDAAMLPAIQLRSRARHR